MFCRENNNLVKEITQVIIQYTHIIIDNLSMTALRLIVGLPFRKLDLRAVRNGLLHNPSLVNFRQLV